MSVGTTCAVQPNLSHRPNPMFPVLLSPPPIPTTLSPSRWCLSLAGVLGCDTFMGACSACGGTHRRHGHELSSIPVSPENGSLTNQQRQGRGMLVATHLRFKVILEQPRSSGAAPCLGHQGSSWGALSRGYQGSSGGALSSAYQDSSGLIRGQIQRGRLSRVLSPQLQPTFTPPDTQVSTAV